MSAVENFTPSKLPQTTGLCGVVQDLISKAASKVALLARTIFETIRSIWQGSLKFLKTFPPLAFPARVLPLIFKKIFTHREEPEEIKSLRLKAEQGDSRAQYELGRIYRDGKNGVKEDIKEAIKWSTRAAMQGHLKAQNNLGCLLLKEKPNEGIEWLRIAAEKNYSKAQYNLGCIYRDGKGGVKKDTQEAVKWFQLAADQGHLNAQEALENILS